MAETLTVTTERVDDIAVLQAHMGHMGVAALLDKHFSVHGNWQGLSLGWVATTWLTHILSQADHRLNHVQPWAEKRCETLRRCTGQALRPLDLSDDRLASVAQALSDDARWQAFEEDLTSHLLRCMICPHSGSAWTARRPAAMAGSQRTVCSSLVIARTIGRICRKSK